MRPGQHNKRGRNRHRSGGGGGGSNGGGNPLSRVYESNGPDVKVRGTAQTVAEKYLQLGRDAQSSGDNVMAESYYQHAEHYLRIVAAAQAYQQQMQQQYRRPGEDFDDEDVGDDQPEVASVEPRGAATQGAETDGMGEQPEESERPPQQQSQPQSQGYRQPREFRDRDQGRDYRDRDNRDNRDNRDRDNRDRDNRDREPRDQNAPRDQLPPQFGGGRDRNRSRWQDRRDQQQTTYEQRPAARAEEAPQPRIEAEESSSGQWEAPSFLRRPAPLPPAEQPAPAEATPAPAPQAAAPERRPRGRPRREKPAEAPEASGSVEPAKEQAD